MTLYSIHQVQVLVKKDLMNKILIIMFILLVGCTSTNKKLETHPTNNKNALEALDKFWKLLKPVRILNGVNK